LEQGRQVDRGHGFCVLCAVDLRVL